MKKIFIPLLLLGLLSCKNEIDKNIVGVWYSIDTSCFIVHYHEAHITGNELIVYNDEGLSYAAVYRIKKDTMIQHLRDIYNDYKVIDSFPQQFIVTVNQNNLKLVNVSNPEANSTWTKIPDAFPYNFINEESIDSFAQKFKSRYKKNYIDIYESENSEDILKYFDNNWFKYKDTRTRQL